MDIPPGTDVVSTGRPVSVPANGSVAPVSLSVPAVVRSLRVLRSTGFDVVHVHEPFAPGLPYGLLAVRRLPPMVATFHRSGGSALYTALRPLTRRLARRFDLRCAVSDEARATAVEALGGTFEVCFNGVEVDSFREVEPWPTDRPAVLFLGRHEERKGLAVLLDAFDRLRARPVVDDAVAAARPVLWIAGDGPQTEALRRRHPPSADIEWLGVLPESEKARRLTAARVLCAPSLGGESFGMVLLEAMAARTAVVASDITGYRDAAGGHAVLVPPGDPGALAERLVDSLAPGRMGGGEPDAEGGGRSHPGRGWTPPGRGPRTGRWSAWPNGTSGGIGRWWPGPGHERPGRGNRTSYTARTMSGSGRQPQRGPNRQRSGGRPGGGGGARRRSGPRRPGNTPKGGSPAGRPASHQSSGPEGPGRGPHVDNRSARAGQRRRRGAGGSAQPPAGGGRRPVRRAGPGGDRRPGGPAARSAPRGRRRPGGGHRADVMVDVAVGPGPGARRHRGPPERRGRVPQAAQPGRRPVRLDGPAPPGHLRRRRRSAQRHGGGTRPGRGLSGRHVRPRGFAVPGAVGGGARPRAGPCEAPRHRGWPAWRSWPWPRGPSSPAWNEPPSRSVPSSAPGASSRPTSEPPRWCATPRHRLGAPGHGGPAGLSGGVMATGQRPHGCAHPLVVDRPRWSVGRPSARPKATWTTPGCGPRPSPCTESCAGAIRPRHRSRRPRGRGPTDRCRRDGRAGAGAATPGPPPRRG